MTIYYRLGGLNNKNLFSYSFGGLRPKTKVPAELVSGENSPPGLQMAIFSLCPHMAERASKQERALVSSYKDTNPI